MILLPPCPLSKEHMVDNFECGKPQLDIWLKRYAWQNQRAEAARTFVVCDERRVVGFYSLAVGAVDHVTATQRIKKGLARYPIPVMILARLAVDLRYQGKKIGKSLLKDALMRTIQASKHAGIRAIFVHAKDHEARMFYEKYGFESSPVKPLKMMLLLKDTKKVLEAISI